MHKKSSPVLPNAKAGTALFWLCWLVYFAAQLGRLNYSVALTGFVDSGFLPKSTAGLIGTAFYVCYGSGQLLSGFLSDRFNCYVLLAVGLAGSGFANLGMSFAGGLVSLAVLWGMNGIFQSLLWTPLLTLFATAMPEEQRARACVNICTTTSLGSFACYGLANLSFSHGGWRPVFSTASLPILLSAAVFIVGAVLLNRYARKNPAPVSRTLSEENSLPEKKEGLGKLLLLSGALFMMLPIAIQSLLKDGMTTWIPTMLTENFSVKATFSTMLTLLLPIPILLGGYFGSWLDKHLFRNELKTASVLFAAAVAGLVVIYIAVSRNIWVCVAALSFVVLCMHGVNMMIISFVPMRFASSGLTGSVGGLLNAAAYFGGAASTYGIGYFAETIGWSRTILLWILLSGFAVVLCVLLIPRWSAFRKQLDAPKETDVLES